jgi:hypothetical protein
MEPNPKIMPSEVEYREIPTEEAAVKSSGTMKRWHRGRHLAAGRRRERKELTRGDCGSRTKLASACRMMSRRAAMARCKRDIFRKIRIQANCEPRKELAAGGMKMIRCAKVAQLNGLGFQGRSHEGSSVEQGLRKNQTRNKLARRTRKDGLMRQEGVNGTRKRDLKSSYGLEARGQPAGPTGGPSGWRSRSEQ